MYRTDHVFGCYTPTATVLMYRCTRYCCTDFLGLTELVVPLLLLLLLLLFLLLLLLLLTLLLPLLLLLRGDVAAVLATPLVGNIGLVLTRKPHP